MVLPFHICRDYRVIPEKIPGGEADLSETPVRLKVTKTQHDHMSIFILKYQITLLLLYIQITLKQWEWLKTTSDGY